MRKKPPAPRRDAFISHASADLETATIIERSLEAAGMDAWLDHSEIQLGVLLAGELQASISDCRVLILLWSQAAAASRWVNTEWLAAHHLDRFILPCVLDDTPLPQCFEHSVHLDLRRDRATALTRLVQAVRAAGIGSNPLPPPMRAESPALAEAIRKLAGRQKLVTDALGRRDVPTAQAAQAALDEYMPTILGQWPVDPVVVMLDGYHFKNGYMIRHWEALQSGRGPADPALEQSERRFFEALWIDPTEPSGLDGLGSILMLRRDLHAAEFFFLCAIRWAASRGYPYPAAHENLNTVRCFLRQRAETRTAPVRSSPTRPRAAPAKRPAARPAARAVRRR